MFSGYQPSRVRRGATLIEALVFVAVFGIITLSFYSAWSIGTRFILFAKNRVVAAELASEKLEVVRNLAFEDVGLTTGSPPGNISQEENVSRSGGKYRVLTQVRNVDDPFDGTLGGSPNDVNFIDYKEVRVTVSWGAGVGAGNISLLSRFVPPGIEQPVNGLGVLVVNVTSDKDEGALVEGSEVRIRNIAGTFDETHATDSFGRLLLVGVPEGIGTFEISLSKSGYENIATLPPYPTSAFNPLHEHASVVEGAVNVANLYQNRTVDLSIRTVGKDGSEVPHIDFSFVGGRIVGSDASDPLDKVYSLDEPSLSTNDEGEYDFGTQSPGEYFFKVTESGTTIVGMNRKPKIAFVEGSPFVFDFSPEESVELTFVVAVETETALVFSVVGDVDGLPIAGAEVRITNESGYDEVATTDEGGFAFFPRPSGTIPFVPDEYDFSVNASGFSEMTGTATVGSGSLQKESVALTAS